MPETNVHNAVHRWWRKIVKLHHPDHGGATEIMAALNDAHDLLLKLLAQESNSGTEQSASAILALAAAGGWWGRPR